MRVKDKDRQRRLARDEREAKKKIHQKRMKCSHPKRTFVEIGVTQCTECGAKIKHEAQGSFTPHHADNRGNIARRRMDV